MGATCVVLGCKSSWNPCSNIRFHSIPTDTVRRNLWMSILPFKNKSYNGATICSLHFKYEDYVTDATCRLKKTAVPIYNVEAESTKVEHSDDDEPESSNYDHARSPLTILLTEAPPANVEIESAKVEQSNYDESEPPNSVFGMPSSNRQIVIASASSSAFSTIGKRSITVQASIKSPRVLKLERENKLLKQRLSRQDKYLKKLKSLFALMKESYKAHVENDF